MPPHFADSRTPSAQLRRHTLRTLIARNVWAPPDTDEGDSPDVTWLDVLGEEDPAAPPARPSWGAQTWALPDGEEDPTIWVPDYEHYSGMPQGGLRLVGNLPDSWGPVGPMNRDSWRATVLTLTTRLPFSFGRLVGDVEWATGVVPGAHGHEWADFFRRSRGMVEGAPKRLMETRKPGWGSMLSVVDGGLTSIPWEDLDPTLVQAIQRESDRLALGDLKDRLRPQDAIETIPRGDEYMVTNTKVPNSPCHVPVPDGVSECRLSELPSSIDPDDETEQDAFFVQTCVEEVENAEYVAKLKPLLSMRVEDPVDEELDPRSRLREYVHSKRKLVARKLCYAKPTRSSWPLKQGRMRDLSQLREDLEQKITTWQREVDLKLRKSVWGAHVRTPEEDDLSGECICEPPRACLCCHRPSELVEQDLLCAYQWLKDTTKGEESVEDHLPTSITQGASNLYSDEDMEDKIKLLDPRVQKLIRTYVEVFGELPPPASCDKLVRMDLKLKPEFVGHKIRRRPYPAPKEQANEIERQIQECIDAGLVLQYIDGDYPQHCSPCFLVAKPGSTAKRLVVDYGELTMKTLNHSGSISNMESTLEKMVSCRYKTKMDKRSRFWQWT